MAELDTDGAEVVNSFHEPDASTAGYNDEALLDYLSGLLGVTLGVTRNDLEADGSLLSSSQIPHTLHRFTKFLLENQTALYAHKYLTIDERNHEVDLRRVAIPQFAVRLSTNPPHTPTIIASVAILKKPHPIDPSASLGEQLQIINLPGLDALSVSDNGQQSTMSPFILLHSVVHSGLIPYFDALSRSQPVDASNHSNVDDQRVGIPGAKKKLAELELSLLQLQQNAEIPHLSLPLHPAIQAALDVAKETGTSPSIDDLPKAVLADSIFHNNLRSTVKSWSKAIQSVTKASRDPSRGTATQEINFWLDMESALDDVKARLDSDGVVLTLKVLKDANQFRTMLSFDEETRLGDTTTVVRGYNLLMREFPLPELLSATSLERVLESLYSVFGHINKKWRKPCAYPVRRATYLVEAISSDLEHRMHTLLNGRVLMQMTYDEFEVVVRHATTIWQAWDENVRKFTTTAREHAKDYRKTEIIKVAARHFRIQERLNYIAMFRKNHEQLQQTILKVFETEALKADQTEFVSTKQVKSVDETASIDPYEEVTQAYSVLKDVDVMDVSADGTRAWDRVEMLYNERTSRVENSIIARLRDRLATAKNANEMFRVFSKFNALFVRPKIRGAISEYQAQLIENVKRDIVALQERFKQQYGYSHAHAMAQLRDLPPISGAIIWARQIEQQLDGYMRKVEDVLGPEWHSHADGRLLSEESSKFREKLDATPILHSWTDEISQHDMAIAGCLFTITRTRASGNLLELNINFDVRIITLFKEVRNLAWLGCAVPHRIGSVAAEARHVYPYAISLMESVRMLSQVNQLVPSLSDVSILLEGFRSEVLSSIETGMALRWESLAYEHRLRLAPVSTVQDISDPQAIRPQSASEHSQFVNRLASDVTLLRSKALEILTIHYTIQRTIKSLETCRYDVRVFEGEISVIQQSVDQLSLENYTNMEFWIAETNIAIEKVLCKRLEQALTAWSYIFQGSHNEDAFQELRPDDTGALAGEDLTGNFPPIKNLLHEVAIRNQIISVEPPLAFARCLWLAQLQDWIRQVCGLRKITSSRYEMTATRNNDKTTPSFFAALLLRCVDRLSSTYSLIEDKLEHVQNYVNTWLQFQSIWDLQSDHVEKQLEDDLGQWLQLLKEMRKIRATFETSTSRRDFGYISIDYEQVHLKINAKYDLWQDDMHLRFAVRLGAHVADASLEIEKARKSLENASLDSSSTMAAVRFITTLQSVKTVATFWTPEVELFHLGQAALQRHRFSFAQDWIFVERIEHELGTLKELLLRKDQLVSGQMQGLRAKVMIEDKAVNEKIHVLFIQWNDGKPISGSIPAAEACKTISTFESNLTKLMDEVELLTRAKKVLGLPASVDTNLTPVMEEIRDFGSVWAALSTVWRGIDDLRDTPWFNVQPRKLKQTLGNLMSMTKDMPSRMRQYAAFDHVQTMMQQLLRVNPIVADLKSDAIHDRHWAQLFRTIKPSSRYSQMSMTLGDVWDLQLTHSEKTIRDILVQAQGEMALEEFVKEVRNVWLEYSLDLVNYHGKCRLIRGWDELFARCNDNLNSLQAMRHSPYYKEFEEEATSWEEKLNRLSALFNVWIDVQRQWVYLEGVFSGNVDIQHLLPVESSRFQNINAEFFAIMKKVQRVPLVLEVLGIPGVQTSLERLLDLLKKIQKALGEYLERERSSFPRFYFVGDEDLLEMIGNGNHTARVARHLGKMFAGVSNLIMEDSGDIIGFTSAQGEEVILGTTVSIAKAPKVNEWLALFEQSMKTTLAELLAEAVQCFASLFEGGHVHATDISSYLIRFPAQVTVLAGQIWWTESVTAALDHSSASLRTLYDLHMAFLQYLASLVLGELEFITRKKCEQLITEFVFQRDVINMLVACGAASSIHHLWLLQLRYVYTPDATLLERLQVKMANANLTYGFEYLGVTDRLVRTPLTERCFLAMTQALEQRLGGSPYGPAGTGKTETVKALGLQLGRLTLVFNCDDTFDYQAMGRIFLGICQVGAWGCFDEFNRLEERILSAVSQQIQNIQLGLKASSKNHPAQIELVGRQFYIEHSTGMFITMNPDYAGRSNLPDNLKKLFRSVAMSRPDKELIAEVVLYSQGFRQAREISKQTVPFFEACTKRMSKQAHYDFGLRALKSVLVSSGILRRRHGVSNSSVAALEDHVEPQIVLQSLHETISPKLVREDVPTLDKIEADTFPHIPYIPASLNSLKEALKTVALARRLVPNDNWMVKALQLFQIQQTHHGIMMVGSSGSGKSSTWKVLLEALMVLEGQEGVQYIIDPKVMSKEALYGSLDSTTREWSDGLFTSILRRIIDNLRGEGTRRHWIVFDGDVDPEWVENLNSVLDDNKILTLPNGERLVLPPNVRLFFEVENLKYATLATISRCGMVWFNNENVTSEMMFTNFIETLRSTSFEDIEEDIVNVASMTGKVAIQNQIVVILETHLGDRNILQSALREALELRHIMAYTQDRALGTLFALLTKACRSILEYHAQNSDFVPVPEQLESFVLKKALLAMIWSFAGDCTLTERQRFGNRLLRMMTIDFPQNSDSYSIIDFDVTLPNAAWTPWELRVPNVEINTHSISQSDVVIPTLDTARHEELIYSWLAEHKSVILCGPPGSGKTMTLFSALRKLPQMEVVGLNFSSATTPDLLLKSFEQHCTYHKTPKGVVLSPRHIGRWLVIFCDEINLPSRDVYGTQRVISFLRQMIEHQGFWRTFDRTWITLNRIQFVGACNPPTDAGRVPLSLRFLRHAPVVMVDHPGRASLLQIYKTLNNAVLKVVPALRTFASALTEAMIKLYETSKGQFSPSIQPHYIYSPRELTRWVKGVYETIKPLENLDVNGLVRIWAHEALRLFQDRLVSEDERQWTREAIRRIALEHFPTIDVEKSLREPVLFSNWLSRDYVPVERNQLRGFVTARLKTFCEEEVDVPIVLYDDALDHVLRIDRVFRQPQGHIILIGVSGSGKTTLARFVAWMNGLKVFQLKVHRKYSAADFDEDLRGVLRRCGCKGERICFIMDESNVLDSAFLERMNTLLANAEVPGLFEGDEYATLMTACREGAQRHGLLLDSQDELYKWFTQQIIENLHVVFTMNPPEQGLATRAATSPALFNRCVINWFGDWSQQALYQVGSELTKSIDLDRGSYVAPATVPLAHRDFDMPLSHRDVVVNAIVYIHHSMRGINSRWKKQHGNVTYLTPRHFLDFLAQYSKLYNEKREDLEDQQRHLNVGLDKLKETVDKVRDLRRSLGGKKTQLEEKDKEANEKLQKMIYDQQKAEQTKKYAHEIERALEKQNGEIARRKAVVEADLAKAEPAVLDAKKSVNNIKRQQLTEVRSMGSPPAGVKLALEAVCTLLGHRVDNWKGIQAIVRRDDFIASIIMYDNETQMTPSHRSKMRKEYLSLEDFTYERVNRASKACGPLVQWVEAQVNFSEILDRVGPLREEVRHLEDQMLDTQAQDIAIKIKIEELETSISIYKEEYAALVSETRAIKSEMTRVHQKVDRSLRLLDSLGSERKRWEEGSKLFETQINTIIGDTLAAAAFLTYGGLYDQQFRSTMLEDWLHHLALSGIIYRPHNPVTEYLSTADERLEWQTQSLPVDDLCTENAIILKRFNRYPLIIDPTGRVVSFLQQQYNGRSLVVTSFLDANFSKQIESALRFGGSILIQDAEYLDPLLNHVLNREYQKTGGRVLVQLGKQEIDFSPNFRLFLSTRDPSAVFAPDICSRTTFVNFTVTQSSLQSQSLNDVLKSERPDVDERRSNLIKMQGEFATHLRQLERRLLQALNESKGNILDDDTVMDTLETVKKEVSTITAKSAETEGVMVEVEHITSEYQLVASSCSAIFAVLSHLWQLNHFYQFSLKFFMGIFESVLEAARRSVHQVIESKKRVHELVKALYITTFRRTSFTMLQKDRLALAMLLAQAAPYKMDRALFDALVDDDAPFNDASSMDSNAQQALIREILARPALKQSNQEAEQHEYLSNDIAEKHFPFMMHLTNNSVDGYLRSLTVTKTLRADRLVPAAELFITRMFGDNLLDYAGSVDELVDQVSSTTPIALCCSPGFDASFRVDNVVQRRKVRCTNVAMGSNEGSDLADKAISQAAASGFWVLIKNVHLAIPWLQSLEKQLNTLKPHADFRLFLSMECNPKIPVNLLRFSRNIMCEQPSGIKANMKDSMVSFSQRASGLPVERARLYLLLSLVHGIIQERLRYAPTLGWSSYWEFNNSDYECAAYVLDAWIEWAAHGRSNIDPSNIPWEMLRALIISTYGGKIDSERDHQRLTDLINAIFVSETFDDGFDIAKAVAMPEAPYAATSGSREELMLPTATGWQEFQAWVGGLPEREPPRWLGLPSDAEKVLLVELGRRMVSGLGTVMRLLDESEQVMAEGVLELDG